MPALVFILVLFLDACSQNNETGFPVFGEYGEKIILTTRGADAGAGKLPLKKEKSFLYQFADDITVKENYSVEIDYELYMEDSTEDQSVIVQVNNNTPWILPLDTFFLESGKKTDNICYAVPVVPSVIKSILFTINTKHKSGNKLILNSIKFDKRKYGFYRNDKTIVTTPFFSHANNSDLSLWTLNPLPQYYITGSAEIILRVLSEKSSLKIGNTEISFRNINKKGEQNYFVFPSVIFPPEPYPITYNGDTDNFTLVSNDIHLSLTDPIKTDPGIVINYPIENWRDKRYEVFCWDIMPSILIFDTADYKTQDNLLKRLAFFAEKKGFRGRLAKDEEIAELHGWNAHDYNAETLARFFDMVRKTNFPILQEEKELQDILIKAGIIRYNDDKSGFLAGSGAIISISRESADYLRRTFMVHEGFHGIFFIDEDFRKFSTGRFEKLNKTAKNFIISFFDYQQYDIKDNYLVVNEFMAHCLQQPAAEAAKYFGENLAGRIAESSWRKNVLPPKDEEAGNWPLLADVFKAETSAFSAYVNSRWGLSAGRLWRTRLMKAG
ncbi:hypothetical protein FACS1894190_09590 [Spirochaetia bacterium]|nr:hypothetical protein FACS1894190_09590 [Spirochaetia bacterium]